MAIVHATEESFAREVLESKQPVLVDFWAAWCGPCRMLAPLLEQAAEQRKSLTEFAARKPRIRLNCFLRRRVRRKKHFSRSTVSQTRLWRGKARGAAGSTHPKRPPVFSDE